MLMRKDLEEAGKRGLFIAESHLTQRIIRTKDQPLLHGTAAA